MRTLIEWDPEPAAAEPGGFVIVTRRENFEGYWRADVSGANYFLNRATVYPTRQAALSAMTKDDFETYRPGAEIIRFVDAPHHLRGPKYDGEKGK